ncbi:UNVERIFIED_CONTAM: hypothetical protein Slati_3736700 [Sesamum latifolium]|uniref:Integrase catalytic domain-containing protein n=1 Tax=Sesamum latifolium TaxID=2727402 RepID=A0AAW2U395_9LAMI
MLQPPKAKGKGARRWKRKNGKETMVTATARTGGAPAAPKGKGKGKVGVLSGRRQIMCACIAKERALEEGVSTTPLQPRKLSKDEMVLRLGDGKAIDVEAVGSLSLVSNLIMTTQHKRKVDNHKNAQIWNARLSHISKGRIRRLVDSKNLEIDNLDHLPTCESCLKGKMTKKPFVGQSAIAKLDLVHTNVCGPLSIPARGGFSYFITFTDDHSRYGYVYLMRYKSEAFDRFKEYRLEVENQTNRKIKALLSDRGGEYLSVFLKKNFLLDSRCDEVLIEESSEEPQHDIMTSFEPTVHTDGVPDLRSSTRESRVPKRYGFVGLTSQLDNDPKTYGEAISDIDSDKWLEAIKFEMDSMG